MRKLLWSAMILLAASLACSAQLIAHYTFDGANPLENKANPGTFDLNVDAGSPTYTTNNLPGGVTGRAAVFDGATGLRSGSTSDFGTTLEKPILKVSFWVKHTNTTRTQPFSFTVDNNNRWDVDMGVTAGNYTWWDVSERPLGSTVGSYTTNVWIKLGFEWDRRDDSLIAYENDAEVATGTLASASEIEGQLWLGRRGHTTPNYLTGEIADVRIELLGATVVTVEGAEAVSKVYDGGTAAEITGGTLVGVDPEHDVSITNRVGVFAQATVGTDIAVTAQLQLTGEDAWRYSLQQPEGLTADITLRDLTITAKDMQKVQGYPLTFDGTEILTDGLVGGDTVTNVTLVSDGAAAEAVVGTYDIVPSAAQGTGLDNYSIAYSNGTLTVVARALVSHYRFDEDLDDSVGSYDLALVTGGGRVNPTYTTVSLANGAVTNAAVFNALQYHRSNDTTQFSNGPATIAFWVKPANTAQEAPLVVHVDNNNHTEFIFMANGSFRVYNNSSASFILEHNIADGYTVGEWMHVAFTYNPTTQYTTLYLDGEEVGNKQLDNSFAHVSGQLMIGRRGGTTVNAFSGQMADVRVYNYGLSAQEIADLMGEEEPVPPPDIESAVIGVDGSDVVVSLSFTPVSGKTYALQFNTNLVDGVWTDVVSGATESPLLYTNEHAAGFFRIKTEE